MVYLTFIPILFITVKLISDLPEVKTDEYLNGFVIPVAYGITILTSVCLVLALIFTSVNNSVEYQRALHDPRYGVDREVASARGMCSNIFSRPFCNKEMAALKTSRELKSENK
jgi:hypothetical protein